MTSLDDDLDLAFELADAADAVSTAHFRSEELRTVTKDDGTPVSEVDLAVEQAMLALVRQHRQADAAIGEEVGPHPAPAAGPGDRAPAARRWIFDGIDGTHNYAAGRTGWGTIVALQDAEGMAVALVTAPRFGQRWWAIRGGGAWTAPYRPDGGKPPGLMFDRSVGTRLRCTATGQLENASVIVIPFEGFLLGWRNTVAQRFTPPAEPRSHCFALDAAMVAEGRLDVAIMTFGSLWDHAGPSLLVTEAGGVFRDAWGGTRLDSTTAVHTNAHLVDQVLDVLAEIRPPLPDEPLLARKVSTPIGTAQEQEADGWRRFGLRPMPSMSARVHVSTAAPAILEIVDERAAELARPFRGVTTDGVVRPRFPSGPPRRGPGTTAVADAAQAFLAALSPEQRQRATFAFDADQWRMWINVHMNHFRHGLMLEDLVPAQREAALDIVRASLSARGFHQARSIMRLNELLAEITGDHEAFGEWPYFLSIFGDPAGSEPWGWQIDGHHLCVNAVAVDGHLVTTPTFMGAEPRRVNLGPLAGISLFDPEESLGLDLIRSLDSTQRAQAVLYPSIHPDHIPALLQNAFDGRMAAGAFHDNLVAPYQGVAGADLSDTQRKLLVSLAATYVGWSADAHAAGRLAEVEAHLDETWFSWYGGTDDSSPFYYRVHSPVLLVEFDHHPGVALDNEEPSRHHVHTVVRTPNGGDYGTDLLADHHQRFDHRQGGHTPRNLGA